MTLLAFSGGYFLVTPSGTPTHFIFGVLLAVGGAAISSVSMLSMRVVNLIEGINYLQAPFYNALCSLLMGLCIYSLSPSGCALFTFTLNDWFHFGLITFWTYTSNVLLSLAYKHSDAATVAPLFYLIGVGCYLANVMVFQISFSSKEAIGIAIILLSLIVPEFLKFWRRNHQIPTRTNGQ